MQYAVKIRWRGKICALGILSVSLLLLLAACGQAAPAQPQAVKIAPSGVYPPSWVDTMKEQNFHSHGQYIAAEAIALTYSLYGEQTNAYYADDPSLASIVAYWKRSCQNADGSLCAEAKSGNLQCVEFVSAVFAQIDDELPYGGDADQFWQLYQGKAGWQEIPAVMRTPPELGDMMVWSGNSSGHLAIVVDWQAPTAGRNGSIVVAEANSSSPFESLTWHANGQIDSWQGYQFQGFIRQQEIAPCLQQQATPIQLQWETLAVEAAVHYGVPSKYFLRQLCQSGFRSEDAQGHTLVSATGALGITQMQESVAAHIPRCVINFVSNAPNCNRMPGSLPAGTRINAGNPVEALPAAAYTMSMLYTHYLHGKGMQIPQDRLTAYKMALAAYNAGEATVDKSVNTCGKTQWLSCLDSQQKNHMTENYVKVVLSVND